MTKNLDSQIERVFVDESGGTHLPESDQDSPDYYVISGIYFSETEMPKFSTAAQKLVHKHAKSGELKSSKIGSNSSRRARILTEIIDLEFPSYCLVVNKSRIWKDSGLSWRPSFYKFLHRMFYSQIGKSFVGVRVLADRHGRSDFMESFKHYIVDLGNVFNDFKFEASTDVPLLQISDVVAGSVRRIYMGKESEEFSRILKSAPVLIEEWPPAAAWDKPREASSDFDDAITGIALEAARQYVEEHLQSDEEDDLLRAHAIRYLLFRFEQDPDEYVLRAEITSHLSRVADIDISEQTLSAKVFADARDQDVIVASTDKGVKLPLGTRDLHAWMERTESQVAPYLRRVEAARRRFLIASHNQHDIADPVSFPELSRYLGNMQISRN